MNLYGSIELSAIPKELFKKVTKKDGTTGIYLNVAIIQRKQASQFGATHFIKTSKETGKMKENGKPEYEDIYIGDLKPMKQQEPVSTEQVSLAPPASDDDLPF